MIFASVGYQVSMFDVDQGQLTRAETALSKTLKQYESEGYLRGKMSAEEQAGFVSYTSSLEDCLKGAIYVQVV